MLTEEWKEELEKILKELIATYGNNFVRWWNDTLFYKIGDEIDYDNDIDLGCIDIECKVESLIAEMKQIAELNPQFELYVGRKIEIDLDYIVNYCVNCGTLSPNLAESFVPESLELVATPDTRIFRHIFDKDPLTQVLDYATLKLGTRSPAHAYICPRIHFVSYLDGDLDYLSIGSAKRGVIAYCTTFDDYKYSIAGGQWELLNEELGSLWHRVYTKLVEYWAQFRFLSKEQRKKYCNIYAFKDLISKEIEEANRLMQKYGIIRVAFPLD